MCVCVFAVCVCARARALKQAAKSDTIPFIVLKELKTRQFKLLREPNLLTIYGDQLIFVQR